METTIQMAFDDAKHIVFLTGAGVSTASGIPDFRSANGLYTQNRNAEYYLRPRFSLLDPRYLAILLTISFLFGIL